MRVAVVTVIFAVVSCRTDSGQPAIDPPPTKWTTWAAAPSGCAVDVRSAHQRLEWRSCPADHGQAGCQRIDAPWAADSGWGFGGLLSVESNQDHTWLALSRAVDKGVWEQAVYRDDEAVAAWRTRIPDSGCILGGPYLSDDGQASMVAIRERSETSPTVFVGQGAELITHPTVVQFGEQPEATVLPRDIVASSGELVLLWERGGRFAVHDRSSDATRRPKPEGVSFDYLQNPVLVGKSVYYWVWRGSKNSIWVHTAGRTDRPVLVDDEVSMDALASDGETLAWTQSREPVRPGAFQTIELWTSHGISPSGEVVGRKLAELPGGDLPTLSIADGWVVARLGANDVRAYRISDGHEMRIAAPASVQWSKAVTSNQVVWLATALAGRPGNDIRFITRVPLR